MDIVVEKAILITLIRQNRELLKPQEHICIIHENYKSLQEPQLSKWHWNDALLYYNFAFSETSS
jgi:hypothetical protein